MTRNNARQLVAPAYLFACLLMGGSVQNIWLNAVLQLAALVMVAWAVCEKGVTPLTMEARQLLMLAGLLIGLVALHLVPLPPAIWSALPGRGSIFVGLAQLQLSPGWQPLSLMPYDTITAGLALLPPLGMLAAIISLGAYSRLGLAVALFLGALLGLGLGYMQVSDVSGSERFYLQPEHNGGTASGFFANPNHMATLLILCVPYLAALLRSQLNGSSRNSRRNVGITVAVAGGALLALFGVLLNHSLAGLSLAVPVFVLSAMIIVKVRRSVARGGILLASLCVVIFVGVLALSVDQTWLKGHAATSVSTRQSYLVTGFAAARDYFPAGSGIGTFERIYRMKEPEQAIETGVYVNHAHDDYLEILIEAGLPGVVLVALFLYWFAKTWFRAAAKRSPDPFALAGGIAAAAILAHSVVDFPLRTSALAVCFATSLAMIVLSAQASGTPKELRPTRHVKIA